MGWGRFQGLGPLVLVNIQVDVNTTACKDILDNYMLPSLWQHFRKGPLLLTQVGLDKLICQMLSLQM